MFMQQMASDIFVRQALTGYTLEFSGCMLLKKWQALTGYTLEFSGCMLLKKWSAQVRAEFAEEIVVREVLAIPERHKDEHAACFPYAGVDPGLLAGRLFLSLMAEKLDVVGGVHNLSDAESSDMFYAAAHTGVIFDYNTGVQRLLQGHVNPISATAVSKDKKWIVTADTGPDSMMVVWEREHQLKDEVIARVWSSCADVNLSDDAARSNLALAERVQPPDGMLRSPTFLVGAERQRKNLDEFKRREQQLAEAYHKNKPLCFNACSYQKTHPVKAQKGHKDADACLTVPLVLGVADGVSQIEDFGIDASMLPNELLQVVEQLGMHQLIPGAKLPSADTYRGPVSMLRRAFEATESLGSLTVVLAVMDNSTRIHGKLHPMIAIITIGDCELIVLRRVKGARQPLEIVCHTEMQRIDGHAQTPLQLARVDARIDPNFHEALTIEVIERGSAVHCVSAYEGDIVIMGSDGVFDNLYLDEIMALANAMLPPTQAGQHFSEAQMKALAQQIVEACHAKTRPGPMGQLREAPIGRGGKKDDTSCVVAEVVEWTKEHARVWATPDDGFGWTSMMNNFFPLNLNGCCVASYDSDDEVDLRKPASKKPTNFQNEMQSGVHNGQWNGQQRNNGLSMPNSAPSAQNPSNYPYPSTSSMPSMPQPLHQPEQQPRPVQPAQPAQQVQQAQQAQQLQMQMQMQQLQQQQQQQQQQMPMQYSAVNPYSAYASPYAQQPQQYSGGQASSAGAGYGYMAGGYSGAVTVAAALTGPDSTSRTEHGKSQKETGESQDYQTISVWDWPSDNDGPVCTAAVGTQDVQTCVLFNAWDTHEIATNGKRRVFFWTWDVEQPFQFYSPALAPRDFKQRQTIFLPESTQAATGTIDGDVVIWDLSLIARVVIGTADGAVRFYDYQFRARASESVPGPLETWLLHLSCMKWAQGPSEAVGGWSVACHEKSMDSGAVDAIHGCNQRAPCVEFMHGLLSKPLRLEQRGATSGDFVQGTSSVIWPAASRLAEYLCDHPELIKDRSVLELGAGLGLVGAACAAAGAKPVLVTDCERALPLLERNQALLAEDSVILNVSRLEWGLAEDHARILEGHPGGFDLLVGSDIILSSFELDKLFESCRALLSRSPDSRLLLAFEFREDWESIGNFIAWAEEVGMEVCHEELGDPDDEIYLYTFRWTGYASVLWMGFSQDCLASQWALKVQAWFEDLLAGSVKSISFEKANEDAEDYEPTGISAGVGVEDDFKCPNFLVST
ncbi:Protein N-lysine methyltransferase METTL21A, partial [Symbiodinium microadriaticum]